MAAVLPDNTLVTNLAQQSCQLAWQVEQKVTENVVFIVAGRDKAGMWNLMFSGVIGNKVALTRNMIARFVEVTVLAVDSKEVVDKATIDLEQVECTNIDEHVDEHRLEIEERDTLTVPQESTRFSLAIIFYCSSFVILIVILIILVGIIFIMPSYEEDADSVGEIINDAFLPCALDFEFVDSESEKQFYKFF